MGDLLGILDRLLGRKKKEKAEPEIKQYELYGHGPGGKWAKLMDSEELIDFDELEDPIPGYAYQLLKRLTTGQTIRVWYRYLEGPKKEDVARSANPWEDLRKALGPIKEFGQEIEKIRGDVRAAFGWAFPEKTGSEGSQIPPLQFKGDLPAYLHPAVPTIAKAWTPVLSEAGQAIGSGLRSGFMGGGAKEEKKEEPKVEFRRPPPSPDDFLPPAEKKKEEP